MNKYGVNFSWSGSWGTLVSHPYHIKRLSVVSGEEGYIEISGFRHWLSWRPFLTISDWQPSFNLHKALYVPSRDHARWQHQIDKYPYVRVHHANIGRGGPNVVYLERITTLSSDSYARYINSLAFGRGDFTAYCNNQDKWIFAVERDITEQAFLTAGVLRDDWLNNVSESRVEDCKELVNYLLELRAKRNAREIQ